MLDKMMNRWERHSECDKSKNREVPVGTIPHPTSISVHYNKKKIHNCLNGFKWRVSDEIIHRKHSDNLGGYFHREDWISKYTDEDLDELQNHLDEIKRLLRNKTKDEWISRVF